MDKHPKILQEALKKLNQEWALAVPDKLPGKAFINVDVAKDSLIEYHNKIRKEVMGAVPEGEIHRPVGGFSNIKHISRQEIIDNLNKVL